MSNLTYTKSEQFKGLEVVILKDGSAYGTQSSYARFSEKAQSTISERCSKLETIEIEDLEAPIGKLIGALIKTKLPLSSNGGLQEVVLIPAIQMGLWIVKDIPELGAEIIKAGATQFLYKVAGYEIKASLPEPKPLELPPVDIRVTKLVDSLTSLGIDLVNPRYQQHLQDLVLNKIIGAIVRHSLKSSLNLWTQRY